MKNRLIALACGWLLCAAPAAWAEPFPAKPITLIVPFAPGASADGVGRVIARELSESLHQSVIVENRPGGGGAVGLMTVARAKPDGYTLGIGATGAIAVNPHLPDASPLKPEKDLTPVARLADIPLVLIAGKQTGYKNLKDMIAAAKASAAAPLTFATTGQYTSQHLAGELVASMAGIKLTAVPYRGSGPAVTDVLGGQIGLAVVDLTSSYPHIKQGSVIALGVTTAGRSSIAPEIPTIAQAGIAGYEAPGWMGLFAPAGLPADISARLATAVKTALDKPDVRQQFINLAVESAYADPQAFAAFTTRESERWKKILQAMPAVRQ